MKTHQQASYHYTSLRVLNSWRLRLSGASHFMGSLPDSQMTTPFFLETESCMVVFMHKPKSLIYISCMF